MTPTRNFIIILAAVAALMLVSVVFETRIAAGGGALLLLGGIIYGMVRNSRASDAQTAQAEAGARRLRRDIESEEARRGAE